MLSETDTVAWKTPTWLVVAVPSTLPWQFEVLNTSMADAASAVPVSAGALLLAGDVGAQLRLVGAEGATVSKTYEMPLLEQAETFPAASVAVANTVVPALAAASTGMLKTPLAVATPVPHTAVLQFELVYSLTVLPASAEPDTTNRLLIGGTFGATDVNTGDTGAVMSEAKTTKLVEHPDTSPAVVVAVA